MVGRAVMIRIIPSRSVKHTINNRCFTEWPMMISRCSSAEWSGSSKIRASVPFELEAHRVIDSVPRAAQIDPAPHHATCQSLELEWGSGLPDCHALVIRRGTSFRRFEKSLNFLAKVARPARFELAAPRLGGGCSIP